MEVIIDGVTYIPKQSSPTPQPPLYKEQGWGIISVLDDRGDEIFYPSDNVISEVLKRNGERIRTVERFSDNVIFSVGDEINSDTFPAKVPYKIKSFKIAEIGSDKGVLYIQGEYPVTFSFPISWSHLSKSIPAKPSPIQEDKPSIVKDKEVLFTTEDGVEIYEEGTETWLVKEDNGYTCLPYKFHKIYGNENTWHLFSTKEAGEKFVLENKPCLSLNDLLEVWDIHQSFQFGGEYYKDSKLYLNFLQKAKQKISQ